MIDSIPRVLVNLFPELATLAYSITLCISLEDKFLIDCWDRAASVLISCSCLVTLYLASYGCFLRKLIAVVIAVD